jgi:hypothetical protein
MLRSSTQLIQLIQQFAFTRERGRTTGAGSGAAEVQNQRCNHREAKPATESALERLQTDSQNTPRTLGESPLTQSPS